MKYEHIFWTIFYESQLNELAIFSNYKFLQDQVLKKQQAKYSALPYLHFKFEDIIYCLLNSGDTWGLLCNLK